jgi:small subunit ribosomal protein S18
MSGERGGGGGGRGRGAKKDDKDKKGERPRGGFFRRRRVCKFCAEKIDYINYKDVRLLSPFIPERGKIQPRRISGTCAKHQRSLQVAIARARQLALIPYVTD